MPNLSRAFILALAAIVATGAVARADNTVFLETGPNYGGANPYQDAAGGEFTAFLKSNGVSLPVPGGYSPLATLSFGGVTGFETFCVQDQVNFWVGTTYDYIISPDLLDPSSNDSNSPVGDSLVPLSQGTAWLYEQFSEGDLAGYDFTNSDPTNTRLQDAGELQTLIWSLDPHNGVAAPTASMPFANLLVTHFGSLANAELPETTDQFGVNVLDLVTYNSDGAINGIYQDQLIYTGGPDDVPDTGATLGLFAGSFMILVVLRRRLALRPQPL